MLVGLGKRKMWSVFRKDPDLILDTKTSECSRPPAEVCIHKFLSVDTVVLLIS